MGEAGEADTRRSWLSGQLDYGTSRHNGGLAPLWSPRCGGGTVHSLPW